MKYSVRAKPRDPGRRTETAAASDASSAVRSNTEDRLKRAVTSPRPDGTNRWLSGNKPESPGFSLSDSASVALNGSDGVKLSRSWEGVKIALAVGARDRPGVSDSAKPAERRYPEERGKAFESGSKELSGSPGEMSSASETLTESEGLSGRDAEF
jgi:hypothetical protein